MERSTIFNGQVSIAVCLPEGKSHVKLQCGAPQTLPSGNLLQFAIENGPLE